MTFDPGRQRAAWRAKWPPDYRMIFFLVHYRDTPEHHVINCNWTSAAIMNIDI
jgi:hypothetical protein